MPIERNNPIVCYVTHRLGLGGAEPAREGAPGRAAELQAALGERIRAAMAAGVDWVQVREKDLEGRELLQVARAAVQAAVGGGARVIVNDRLDVAVAAGAAGVHLGRESLAVSDVAEWRRARKGPGDFWIGASCHSAAEARAAEADGADYIFFGPVFRTPSKEKFGEPQGLGKLAEACAAVKIPVLGIGGIDAGNAAECLRAGAAGIAAIRMFQDAASERELREAVARVKSR